MKTKSSSYQDTKENLFTNPSAEDLKEMKNAFARSAFREKLLEFFAQIQLLIDHYDELPFHETGNPGPETHVMERLCELLYKLDPEMAKWPEFQMNSVAD